MTQISSLGTDIQQEYQRLIKIVIPLPISLRTSKVIDGTGGKVSAADLIAYQIGWGKCLIRWYELGIAGNEPDMPGDGFSTWDYVAIAKHFYEKYCYDSFEQQLQVFDRVVSRILEMVTTEDRAGNLDRVGVWPWCTLPSGKQWPLSKWVRVNTASPYKRATQLIKKALYPAD